MFPGSVQIVGPFMCVYDYRQKYPQGCYINYIYQICICTMYILTSRNNHVVE